VGASSKITVAEILEQLESVYGPQQPGWPADPCQFVLWWNAGYPQSDANCARGWESLSKSVGVRPEQILAASDAQLVRAATAGGMVPESRAARLKEIAARVVDECGGNLRERLSGSLAEARKLLKKFPTIGDPGADRILLFAGIAPIAAVPSNCPHVLVRILRGRERENYGVTYREAQQAIEAQVPASVEARQRAFLLLKRHGQEVCKRKPACDRCSLRERCAYASGSSRGRATLA